MKKFIIVSLIILIALTTLLLNYQSFSNLYTSAMGTINIYNTSIPYEVLSQYKSGNPVEKKEAESELKKICLNIIEYPNWQNYLDYINLKIYTGNVLPQNGDELLIVLNLSKDLAVICIFADNGQSYSYFEKIDNLMPIESVEFIGIPDKEYDFLSIYQIADERLGAYYYENFFEIFMYNGENFTKKLKETIFFEEIFKSIWIDDTAPKDEWNKNMIKNTILFKENSSLVIAISGTKNKYKASSSDIAPEPADFKLVDSSSYKYKYFWNKDSEEFSRNDTLITFNDLPVFIIGDSDNDYKNLCNFSKNKYKLLTTSGKIIYIDKNLIDDNITISD